ncbi:uncharacterized SAM-binding protein YcdF (DUF218 family) [Frondihabitans sp. PhB161]|nr:uncharacterized SAM-binding protein YcdF (DUF218 family) [Frondihabitans sp. PhB153]RPF08639.1 uncharacterized SAM-binding protein YcdF (DUF218 family) [Frondihabitans sp. PhB161]
MPLAGRGAARARGYGVPMRIMLPVSSAAALAGLLCWSEWLHVRASARSLGSSVTAPGREAILVPGCKNKGPRANAVNRYRVRVALRSVDPKSSETVLVLSGGAVGNDETEAEILLRYARSRGYSGPHILEGKSRTTWENVANTAGLLEAFDTVKVASNSLHAARVRDYLWAQCPEVAHRLVKADDYRLGEIPHLKPVMALRSAWHLLR